VYVDASAGAAGEPSSPVETHATEATQRVADVRLVDLRADRIVGRLTGRIGSSSVCASQQSPPRACLAWYRQRASRLPYMTPRRSRSFRPNVPYVSRSGKEPPAVGVKAGEVLATGYEGC
jgi:hypothetical protein